MKCGTNPFCCPDTRHLRDTQQSAHGLSLCAFGPFLLFRILSTNDQGMTPERILNKPKSDAARGHQTAAAFEDKTAVP